MFLIVFCFGILVNQFIITVYFKSIGFNTTNYLVLFFANGKLNLNGDFLYSFARTLIGVDGGQYVQTPASVSGRPYYYISAADMPTVKTQTFQFKLDAKYSINKINNRDKGTAMANRFFAASKFSNAPP